jgi:hypothetical protein
VLNSSHNNTAVTLPTDCNHYTTLYYTTLHCTTLHYTTLHYTTLHCYHTHISTPLQVDLGASARIDHIKVWNRCDTPQDPSLDPDLYSKRLFPAWIAVADAPFSSTVGGDSLRSALNAAKARCKLTEAKRCSVWRLPEQSNGRYIRVQIEGFDFLHLAEVQVCFVLLLLLLVLLLLLLQLTYKMLLSLCG